MTVTVQRCITASVGRVEHLRASSFELPSPRARARFWAKVDKSGGMFACWPWLGKVDDGGYGRYGDGSVLGELFVHRIAWVLVNERPIPDGLDIDHVRANGCTLRHCANAFAHLEPVTHFENCRRGSQAQQTHCKHGHSLDPADGHLVMRTRKDGTPYRQCATCCRARNNGSLPAGRGDERGVTVSVNVLALGQAHLSQGGGAHRQH